MKKRNDTSMNGISFNVLYQSKRNQMCERSAAERACEGEAGAPLNVMECSIVHLMKIK